MNRVLKSGKNWRLGWNPDAPVYQGLIGSDDWAFELTKAELEDFCRLLNQLSATMETMAEELMDEEKITCELETDLIFLEVYGYPQEYSLRLILSQNRCCEGNWHWETVQELIIASQNLKHF